MRQGRGLSTMTGPIAPPGMPSPAGFSARRGSGAAPRWRAGGSPAAVSPQSLTRTTYWPSAVRSTDSIVAHRDQRVAVDAHEVGRELDCQRPQRLVDQVAPAAVAHGDVLLARGEVQDVLDRDQAQLVAEPGADLLAPPTELGLLGHPRAAAAPPPAPHAGGRARASPGARASAGSRAACASKASSACSS